MQFVKTKFDGKEAVAVLAQLPYFYSTDVMNQTIRPNKNQKRAKCLFIALFFRSGKIRTHLGVIPKEPRITHRPDKVIDIGHWLPEENEIKYLIDNSWVPRPNKRFIKERFFDSGKPGFNNIVPEEKVPEELYLRVIKSIFNIYP